MNITRRSLIASCGFVVTMPLAGCSSSNPTAEGSWPRRDVNNAHTGYVDMDAPTSSLSQYWERSRSARGSTSPIMSDGRVYFAYSQSPMDSELGGVTLEAFDAENGDSLWTADCYETEESHDYYLTDSLVLNGDWVFVQTRAGLQTVGTDGKPGWTFPNLGAANLYDASPPVVTDDMVVISTNGTSLNEPETVYGVSPADGEELWRAEFPELSRVRWLAADDGVVYVSAGREGIAALEVASGDELWRRSLPVGGQLSVADDRVIVGVETNAELTDEVAALDTSNGERLWRRPSGYLAPTNGFCVAGETVYNVAARRLTARHLDTGERRWRFPDSNNDPRHIKLHTTPAVAGDAVYVTGTAETDDPDDRLYILNRQTGDMLASYSIDHSVEDSVVPAISSGLLYVGSDGTLAAVG